MMGRSRLCLWFLVLVLLGVGCAEPAGTATPSSTPTTQPGHTPTLPAVADRPATTTPTATNRPSAIPSRTPAPTVTSRPSITPSPTLPPTATVDLATVPRLTERQPSLAVLAEYLTGTPWRYYFWDHGSFNIFGEAFDSGGYTDFIVDTNRFDLLSEYGWPENARLYFTDVNADGIDDLIVTSIQPFIWGFGFMAVFLWERDSYQLPLVIVDSGKYGPRHTITFADWSGDGRPEIVYDFHRDIGGTGYSEHTVDRFIVNCQATCRVIWSGLIDGFAYNYNDYALGVSRHSLSLTIPDTGQPTLIWRGQSFYGPGGHGHQIVSTWQEDTYIWDGTTYVLTGSETSGGRTDITYTGTFTATNETGAIAQVMFMEAGAESATNPASYDCILLINNTRRTQPFPCLPAATTVTWQNVLDEDQPALVVITPVLPTPYGNLYDRVRLLIYRPVGDTHTLVADITGNIIEPGLYGIRLVDLEDDGIFEVMAGNLRYHRSDCWDFEAYFDDLRTICWREPVFEDTIYRWNGAAYEYAYGQPNIFP